MRKPAPARRPRCVAATLLILAGCAAAAGAAERVLQHGIGPGALAILQVEDSVRLRLGSADIRLEVDPTFDPHDVARDDRGWVVAGSFRGLDRRERLAIVAGRGERQRELGAPPGQTGRARTLPVLLDGSRIAAGEAGGGIAWLEGSSPGRLAIWASEWTGDRFEAPVLVAPEGPGTQTALAGAVLDDGTWLLAWAGYDGNDDEILWSARTNEGWSEPRRVAADDSWPDLTPALLPTDGGAAAAWSSYDGEQYRLVLAFFRDGEWSPPELQGATIGLYPEFVRGAPVPTISYLEAEPRRWTVAELDAPSRRVLLRASLPSSAEDRPFVAARDERGVRLVEHPSAPAGSSQRRVLLRPWQEGSR